MKLPDQEPLSCPKNPMIPSTHTQGPHTKFRLVRQRQERRTTPSRHTLSTHTPKTSHHTQNTLHKHESTHNTTHVQRLHLGGANKKQADTTPHGAQDEPSLRKPESTGHGPTRRRQHRRRQEERPPSPTVLAIRKSRIIQSLTDRPRARPTDTTQRPHGRQRHRAERLAQRIPTSIHFLQIIK
jgi:hypothetical protein